MRTMLLLTIAFSTIIIMIGVSGCMGSESLQDKMVAYMNDKYDDTFVYGAPFGGGAGATTKQIVVKSEKFPDADIWVEYYVDGDEEFFIDNYVNYKYEKETRELLISILNDVFKHDVVLSFGVPTKGRSNSFTNETSFKEYVGSKEASLGFIAVVSNLFTVSDKEAVEKALLEALEKNGVIVNGDIYFAQEAEQLKDAFKIPVAVLDTLTRLTFTMANQGEFDSCKWR